MEQKVAFDHIITHDQHPERFPILQSKALDCQVPPSEEDKAVIANMIEILVALEEKAVGLAASQVGYAKRIFVMKKPNGTLVPMINAEIICRSLQTTYKPEGCLSLPNMVVKVQRPKRVTVKYFDTEGVVHIDNFEGLEARIIFHETDHNNGILLGEHMATFLDKKAKLLAETNRIRQVQKAKRRRLTKLRRQ